MEDGSIILLVVAVLMVVMSAYFSATETAFTSLNRVRLKSRADAGDRRSKLALDMSGNYDRLMPFLSLYQGISVLYATMLCIIHPSMAYLNLREFYLDLYINMNHTYPETFLHGIMK